MESKLLIKLNYANNKSIDYIICDHHKPGPLIPDTIAVLNPLRDDCNYPFKYLCGCGIGFKLIQALDKVKNQKLDSFVRAQREENNNKVFEASVSGVRQLYKALISNQVVCLAPDQVPQDGMGEYVKLFNRDSYTTTLVPSLALKTNM